MRRQQLIGELGAGITRFQDATRRFDDVAAEVLALERDDLPCVSLLMFSPTGATPEEAAQSLTRSLADVRATFGRLEQAGYARLVAQRLELTELARGWIQTLWGPLQDEAAAVFGARSLEELEAFAQLLRDVAPIQVRHAQRLRGLLAERGAKASRARLAPAALRRVELFVDANLSHPLTISQLAQRAGLSTFHFARAFKASVGTTPHAFVAARRVAFASRLLEQSDRPLADIALAVGFSSQSQFSTVFRRVTGMTPAAFRRLKSDPRG